MDDAVALIIDAVRLPPFQTTQESQQILDDRLLGAKIHAMLVNFSFMIEVEVNDGAVTLLNIGEVLRTDKSLRERIESSIKEMEGVRSVHFAEKTGDKKDHVNPFYNIG